MTVSTLQIVTLPAWYTVCATHTTAATMLVGKYMFSLHCSAHSAHRVLISTLSNASRSCRTRVPQWRTTASKANRMLPVRVPSTRMPHVHGECDCMCQLAVCGDVGTAIV